MTSYVEVLMDASVIDIDGAVEETCNNCERVSPETQCSAKFSTGCAMLEMLERVREYVDRKQEAFA